MLKLTLKPGEYINIGDDVKVVFSGGSANNIHLLIDAPRETSIVRSNAAANRGQKSEYYSEKKISEQAQREIAGIIMREKGQKRKTSTTPLDQTRKKPEKRYYVTTHQDHLM